MQSVEREELPELHVVSNAARVVEHRVEVILLARYHDVLPELAAKRANLLQRLLQALSGARHADVIPHDAAELAMELPHGSLALDAEHLVDPPLGRTCGLLEGVVVGRQLRKLCAREVV